MDVKEYLIWSNNWWTKTSRELAREHHLMCKLMSLDELCFPHPYTGEYNWGLYNKQKKIRDVIDKELEQIWTKWECGKENGIVAEMLEKRN